MWIVIGAYPDGEIDERLWFRSLTSPTFLKMIVEVVVKYDAATGLIVEGDGAKLILQPFIVVIQRVKYPSIVSGGRCFCCYTVVVGVVVIVVVIVIVGVVVVMVDAVSSTANFFCMVCLMTD